MRGAEDEGRDRPALDIGLVNIGPLYCYTGIQIPEPERVLSSGHVERRLMAILAADVAGYSRLMGADEEGTLAHLKSLRKTLIDPKIAEHRGHIVKTTGDGMLVEFASAVDAARCAVEIQHSMAEQNADAPQDNCIKFRIGVHVGDIIIDDNDIFGDGVNIAAPRRDRGARRCLHFRRCSPADSWQGRYTARGYGLANSQEYRRADARLANED
jgi:Adenylate and Guanylate cyclase catalytic domain